MPRASQPQPASSAVRLVAGALAVVLPALVLAVGLSLLLASRDEELPEPALKMHALLDAAQPEVVVVGNSMVAASIDPEKLGAGLADRPVVVTNLWESGTWPANWYLFLKNRVFGQGHQPHAVIVCMTPLVLVQPGLSTDLNRRSLANHVGEYEPVVYQKVFGQQTPNPWIQRLRDQRGRFQELWAAWIRDASVGLFHGDAQLGLLERGQAAAAPALERVFQAEGAVDMSLHRRVIPVVEHSQQAVARSDGSAVAGSFVPDLLDLAEEHGSKMVFVWMANLPEVEAGVALEPAAEAELVRLLNERGAAYIDMHGLGYPAYMFQDGSHLSAAGRARFTAELAAVLRERGVMEDGPFAPNRVPLALDYSIRLTGQIPDLGPLELLPDPEGQPCRHVARVVEWTALGDSALSAARIGNVSPLVVLEDGVPMEHLSWPGKLEGPCHGAYVPQAGLLYLSPGAHADPPREQRSYHLTVTDQLPVRFGKSEGWFVYPGTQLVLDFTGWPGPQGDLEVVVGLEPLIGAAAGASVTAAGLPVDLEPQGARLLRGTVVAPTPLGPWSISVASAADGPWLAVRWLAVRSGGETVDLVGSEEAMEPVVVSFMTWADQSVATVQGDPPRFPLSLEPAYNHGAVKSVEPSLDDLSSAAIGARTACGRCTPLRLSEDGQVYERPGLYCAEAYQGEPGNSCHRTGEFTFTSSDGSDPLGNGRHYELVLQPERQHKQLWWVYPGDHARLPLPGLRKRELRDGARFLRLEGLAMAGERQDAQVHIRLLVGEQEVLAESVPVRSFDDGPFERDMGSSLDLRGKSVVLELRSDPDAPFLLLTKLELGE